MRAVENLIHEHRVIELSLAILQAMVDRLGHEQWVPPERLQALIEFFSLFVDRCHHAKEEGVLFPALEGAGIRRAGGPVGVMLLEHKEARALLHRMADVVPQLRENRAARTQFIQASQGYAQLLRDHIAREENVLFRMADRLLADKDVELSAACARHERGIMGEGAPRFHQVIAGLEREFLGEPDEQAQPELIALGVR